MAATAANVNASDTAQEQFAKGEYQEGVRILKQAAGDRTLTTGDRLTAMVSLARFYASQVGDVARAMASYRRALKILDGKSDARRIAPASAQAWTELDHLIRLEKTHRSLNTRIRRMKADSFKRIELGDTEALETLHQNVYWLQAIIADHPRYYRIHDVYYTLGLTHLALQHPYRAYRAFGRALDAKPAMSLAQPVSRLSVKSRAQWIRRLSRQIAWTTLGLLLAAVGIGGICARPWQWLRLGHLITGLVVIAFWCGLFYLTHRGLADTDAASVLINSDNVYPTPVFVHMALGSPGSEVAAYLFGYGLAAVTGIFLFSVALGRIRRRMLATVLGAVFAILVSSTLATIYTLDHCDTDARRYPRATASTAVPSGYLAYPINDPEPYLLTNPHYYQGLDLSSIDDPVLIDWLRSYAIASGEH
ncbi:uncharacterized protein Dvar_11900 [Desulfosarcina variabilis str. Montpellier]